MGIFCKNCEKWYGSDDDGFGPCSIKNGRGDKRFITFACHHCDEIYRDLPDTMVSPNLLGH